MDGILCWKDDLELTCIPSSCLEVSNWYFPLYLKDELDLTGSLKLFEKGETKPYEG